MARVTLAAPMLLQAIRQAWLETQELPFDLAVVHQKGVNRNGKRVPLTEYQLEILQGFELLDAELTRTHEVAGTGERRPGLGTKNCILAPRIPLNTQRPRDSFPGQ